MKSSGINQGILWFWSLAVFWMLCAAPGWAASPLAVLKSDKNAGGYQEQHLGNYDDAWVAFQQTLNAANLRYDLLTDDDTSGSAPKLKEYKLIVVPLLVDLTPDAAVALSEYVKGGGKLVVTDGGGVPTATAQLVNQLAGVTVEKHTTTTESTQLVWKRDPLPLIQEFSIGTLLAWLTPAADAVPVASWKTTGGVETQAAVVRSPRGMFLSWAPGLQGEISTNASLLSIAMEDLVSGITQQAAVQISFADYQTISQELEYLTKRTEEAIKTAKQADLAVPFKTIQANYESAMAHTKSFHDAYKNREFYVADDELHQARQDFSLAFAQSMPVRPVEARSVWLDRGTIIATKNAEGMSALFDRLKRTGINTVYFETNNAGFAMFPSSYYTQNPNTIGWSPLEVAVKEAHKRGMELHAWCWIFAVGNMRHNPIIGKEKDYPGPVLSTRDFSWALAGQNGALLPAKQPEFWIDPANIEGRKFIKDFLVEVVSKFPVDGLQLDYIRYPFNNKGTEMGYDWVGRSRFEEQTGMSLDKLDDATRELWKAWKIQQVNEFVRDVSHTLKSMKPGFRISAAVYAMPRRLRLNAVQQEWETWVSNGWVDTLNPMTYVTSAADLSNVAGYVRESTSDKALVYPGLSIRQLDTAGLIEQLDTSRAIGTLGTTMFACAQLDDKKMELLKLGPYRKQTLLTPQSQPIRASRMLINDFAAIVNRYLQDPKKRILSDQSSTNEVMSQIMGIQRQFQDLRESPTSSELEALNKEVLSLHNTVKEWLRLEAFIQRGYRAQYIANYLGQVEAIMAYAAQRARVQEQVVADSAAAATLPRSE